MLTAFKILWVIDAIAALIILYFFVIGLGDGTVSERNAGLWLLIVLGLGAILIGSVILKNNHHTGLGIVVLLILGIPAFLYLLFIIVALSFGGRWN